MVKHTIIHSGLKIIFLTGLCLICLSVVSLPVPAQGFSVSYGDVEFVVSPGDRITATLNVINQSDERIVLRIYSGDMVRVQGEITNYEFDEEGGNETRSFLDWMSFSPDQMVLEPGDSQDILCEVNFPEDPTLEGSYWGVIFIQEATSNEPGIEVPEDEGMQVGITTIFRYAIKIYSTFEGTEIREGLFIDLPIEHVEDRFIIHGIFENSGNIYMRPEVWLEIRNPAGEVIYQQDHIRQTVLPETIREYIFELSDQPFVPGSYLVMVIADYGGPTLVAAQGRMEISAEEAETVEQ